MSTRLLERRVDRQVATSLAKACGVSARISQKLIPRSGGWDRANKICRAVNGPGGKNSIRVFGVNGVGVEADVWESLGSPETLSHQTGEGSWRSGLTINSRLARQLACCDKTQQSPLNTPKTSSAALGTPPRAARGANPPHTGLAWGGVGEDATPLELWRILPRTLCRPWLIGALPPGSATPAP